MMNHVTVRYDLERLPKKCWSLPFWEKNYGIIVTFMILRTTRTNVVSKASLNRILRIYIKFTYTFFCFVILQQLIFVCHAVWFYSFVFMNVYILVWKYTVFRVYSCDQLKIPWSTIPTTCVNSNSYSIEI